MNEKQEIMCSVSRRKKIKSIVDDGMYNIIIGKINL